MHKVYTANEILQKLLYKRSENRKICFVLERDYQGLPLYVKCSVPEGISLLNEKGKLDGKLFDKYRINNITFYNVPCEYSNGKPYILTDSSTSSCMEYDMTLETMKEVRNRLKEFVIYTQR